MPELPNGPDAAQIVLTAGASSLTLEPGAGGRASSLVVDGLELLAHDADTAVGWGWYPMAPWPGRLRDNALVFHGVTYPMPVSLDTWAIHGTVYDIPWRVDSVRPDNGVQPAGAVLSVALAAPWPWDGRVSQTWRLDEHSLETLLEVSSDGEEFPAELGWHPWFRKQLASGGRAQLDLPATEMLARGPDHLPTGARVCPVPPGPYDDTFPLPGGEVGLIWPGALRLRCETDCGYVVVYDERPDAICIEPQTAPPDGINGTAGLVRPGEPRRVRAVWRWSPDLPGGAAEPAGNAERA